MSANRDNDTQPWIVTCEICDATTEHDAALTIEQLGEAIRAAGWTLPIYGGTFCPRCQRAIETLSNRKANR